MSFGIKLKVWGDYACFTRPEMKVERVSYDVITPSAARGILEAIYWKPQMCWVVDRLHVLNPIRFTHIRRNEISGKIPIKGKTGVMNAMKGNDVPLGASITAQRQQRAAMVLRDVGYVIEAHVETNAAEKGTTCPVAKHLEMFKRRAGKGQYFHHPYLGTREFPASFELVDKLPQTDQSLKGSRDLGWMLHDVLFISDPKGAIVESNRGERLTAEPRFFRGEMIDGVIEIPPLEHGRA